MRKHLSVFMLYNRLVLYRLLAVIAVSGVLQLMGVRYRLFPQSGLHDYYQTPCMLIFMAAFLATVIICIGDIGTKSRIGYTLKRLQISEASVLFWHCAAGMLAFLLLWLAQIAISFEVISLCRQQGAGTMGPQGIMLDVYRNIWLHSVMPLDDGWTLGRNIVFCVCAGISCASISLMYRHGEKSFCSMICLLIIQSGFIQNLADASVRSGFYMAAVIIFAGLGLMYAGFEANTGKRESAYD